MNVHWTESALNDLQAIEAYISRRSPQYARGLVERVFARSERLATHPRSGPVVPEYRDESLRELFEDPYRIVYRILDDRVDIIAVVHSARRMPRAL
jgi:addiction module RelE/StbE family toxin